MQHTPPAETRCLLRFSLLSALVHAATLAILLTWTSGMARTRPLVQVMTIDLTQIEPSPQQAVPPAKPAPASEPQVRPEPVPARVQVRTAELPTLTKPLSPTPTIATPAAVQGPSVAAPARVESSTIARPSSIIPAAPPATVPPHVPAAKRTSEKSSVRANYMSLCRDLIERHKEYPVMARKGRKEGAVVILGTLARDGSLRRCIVNRSSGSGLLDNAAIRAVRSVNQFPPVPPELAGEDLVFELPISFRLSVE